MKNLSFLRGTALVLGLVFWSGCATKEVKQQVSLAANRVMGFVVRSSQPLSPEQTLEFTNLAEKSLQKTYGGQLVRLNFAQSSIIEEPENLYQIGSHLIDDLFIFEMGEMGGSPESTVTIYNGSNLKIVTVLKFAVPREGKEVFEERYISTFERVALQHYQNPNIYPKSDPRHFADLLYVYSQEKEKSLQGTMTCETAEQTLGFYSKAEELYRMAQSRGSLKAVGAQEDQHILSTRSQESAERAQVLVRCREDAAKTFEVSWDFSKVDPGSHEMIKTAAKTAQLEEILRQYSNKPVEMRFRLEDSGELTFLLVLRFDQNRYRAWTKDRIPSRARNFNILSFDPFYALMQKMIVFRASLPAEAPPALRASFERMKMTLSLNTILNGQTLLGVDGKYDLKSKSIAMAYPNSALLSAPGFETKLIQGKDREIFQEKTWLALGNCKTVDGTVTEDGLLLQFFGLPCN